MNLNAHPCQINIFIKLLELCSTNVMIQKEGLAMGSPPAPLLANIWLANLEELMRDDAKLFGRYMDDVIRSITGEQVDQNWHS